MFASNQRRSLTTLWRISYSSYCSQTKTFTFPSVSLEGAEQIATEVSLLAKLGHGAGDHLWENNATLQRQHNLFNDALEEPSAVIGIPDVKKGDTTALHTFSVDQGHPWHRHRGHRVFIAISGSAGCELRFSSVSPSQDKQLESNPSLFLDKLHRVQIPSDSMFSVRFDGKTWHQFAPVLKNHPAFFAVSVHTDETGGLSGELLELVKQGKADIASLTELLPPSVTTFLEKNTNAVETSSSVLTLSLEKTSTETQRCLCTLIRSRFGTLRSSWARRQRLSGWVSRQENPTSGKHLFVYERKPEKDFLYHSLLKDEIVHYESYHELGLPLSREMEGNVTSSELMEAALDGFIENRPKNVSFIMNVRNFLVAPMRLRTSSLGCPVSSLLGKSKKNLFADRFPVFDVVENKKENVTEVELGAADRHVNFRSSIRVEIKDGRLFLGIGTKVHCKNTFGHLYMKIIDLPHTRVVTPAILQHSAAYITAGLDKE